VHLHAGNGLAGRQLPTVDFGLLLQAITTSTTPRQVEAAPTGPPIPAEPTAPAASTADARPDTSDTAGRAGGADPPTRHQGGTGAGCCNTAGWAWPAEARERREDGCGTGGDRGAGPEGFQDDHGGCGEG